MKSAIIFMAVVASAFANLEFCSDITGTHFASVEAIYKPDPIVVAKGETISFHVGFDLLSTLEVGSIVSLKLIKDGVVPITLSCIAVPSLSMNLGSCDYNIQDLFDAVIEDGYCKPEYMPDDDCKLPFLPGHYGGAKDQFISFTLPEIPAFLAKILTGNISFKAILLNRGVDEMACVTGQLRFA